MPGLRGRRVSAVIWTTTPWTLPGNLALAFHPDADYAFYPVEGTDDVLLLARALRESAAARWNRFEAGLGEPIAEMKGAAFEGLRFRHPWIDRDSPGRARRLRDHSTPGPASCTPRPATAGTTT